MPQARPTNESDEVHFILQFLKPLFQLKLVTAEELFLWLPIQLLLLNVLKLLLLQLSLLQVQLQFWTSLELLTFRLFKLRDQLLYEIFL